MPGSATSASVPVLPPHQQLAAPGKWPTVGETRPRQSAEPWTLSITGLVGRPTVWRLEELRAMPAVEHAVDIHCVTRWSKPAVRFRGVPLRHLLQQCHPLAEARFLVFTARSERNHSTSLGLADALALDALVAWAAEGKDLEEVHGGPLRTVIPGRYFYKSLKWLEKIEVLAEDRPGYWESEAGYHNTADPWREQRYAEPRLDRALVRTLIHKRDFSKHDLRSIDLRKQDLSGLNARAAVLRDAHFERANLEGACFDGANLTNAHLEGANLRRASFVGADLEGANFRGADLRGADLTGAALTAITLAPQADDPEPWGPAILDAGTRIDKEAMDKLTPFQQRFLEGFLT